MNILIKEILIIVCWENRIVTRYGDVTSNNAISPNKQLSKFLLVKIPTFFVSISIINVFLKTSKGNDFCDILFWHNIQQAYYENALDFFTFLIFIRYTVGYLLF